jgi:formylmethanofuran dehydrogenase subunit C
VKPLTLALKTKPPCRVDAAPLVPGLLEGKSRTEIERVTLTGWNETFRVGDLFSVKGEDAGQMALEALDGSFLRVGAGLDRGEIVVVGNAGDYCGEAMTAGSLTVKGKAGDYLGCGMKGGTASCSGNAGSFAGSGRAGEMTGMRGGTIVIRGDAGDRCGDRMRRGLLLVEGGVGQYCASRMLAGSVVVLGSAGSGAGYLMRRGTVVFAERGIEIGATFNHSGDYELLALRLLLRSLARHGGGFKPLASSTGQYSRWLGDLGAAGKGEIFVAR